MADAGCVGAQAVTAEAEAQKQCEVCQQQAAKYCCPRCDRRTCSLDCVKAHKEATGCSGKRDRTRFVGRAEFDERTFLSDYRFLEEVKLADDVAKRSKPPAPKLDMPQFLQTLMYQARRRGVQLHILSPGMEKRRNNSTRYDGRMQLLHWHVEWSFPAAGCKVADTKVHENTVMAELLRGHLALQPGAAAKHHALREYNEAGQEALTVVLRKERTPANAVEFYEIDMSRPLRQQLAGKVIVEFPTFIVLLPSERGQYNILPVDTAAAAAAVAAPGTGMAAGHEGQAAGGLPEQQAAAAAQLPDDASEPAAPAAAVPPPAAAGELAANSSPACIAANTAPAVAAECSPTTGDGEPATCKAGHAV